MSCLPVPLAKAQKLSPPVARNEFTVTEYVAAESIGVPLSHMPVIREPAGFAGS